jgi:hypothetical protein
VKPVRALLGLAALLVAGAGCNTYHYYDITLKFDSSQIPEEQAGYLQKCTVDVTGAASDTIVVPDNNAMKSYCPVTDYRNFPTLGTFEFATFADSGNLTFTFNGYDFTMASSQYLCATGSVSFQASSTITQAMDLTIGSGPNTCVSQTQQ